MLTQKPTGVAGADHRTTRRRPRALDDADLLLRGRLRPDARRQGQHHDPRVHVRDGDVRGHPRLLERGAGRLYGLKLREHVERIRQSCRILLMEDVPSVDELTGLIVETVRRNGFREDAYIRPSFYKSTKAIGVRLHDLENELYIIALPFGNYIDTEAGVRVMTSSWRRNADEALPARGKIVGGYVNMAFQKSEAELNGFDEALVLTADGHVNEASAANLFVVRDGVALTPPVSDDILEGVTRKAIMELLAQRGHPGRDPLDRPLRAVRRRRDVPVRHRRPDLAGHRGRPSPGRRRARSARSAGWSASATSTPSAAGCPSTATG